MEAIKAAAGPDLRLVTDVGQHQMWAAQFFEFTRANSHITSRGLGTMGFALPAAMGVAFAYPEDPVWVIAGDGGIQMNIQELRHHKGLRAQHKGRRSERRLSGDGPPVATVLPAAATRRRPQPVPTTSSSPPPTGSQGHRQGGR